MKWGIQKKAATSLVPQELPEGLATCQEKNEFFVQAIQALLTFITDFALDIKELKSDIFKQKLAELETLFEQDQK